MLRRTAFSMLSIAQRTITQSSVASRPSNYERLVRALLRDCLITAPPVDLGIICDRAHISLERSFLPDTVSGFLYNQDGRTIIGVNPRHSTRRQRFTIAHELAHFFLGHQGDGVHVDKNLALFRDSDQVSDVKESAANLCAAELLMPKQFLIKD